MIYCVFQAAEHYKRALQCVEQGGAKDGAGIHASMSWDLSSTYFDLAKLLQDRAPLATTSQEQVKQNLSAALDCFWFGLNLGLSLI